MEVETKSVQNSCRILVVKGKGDVAVITGDILGRAFVFFCCVLEEGFRVGAGEEGIDNNGDNVIVLAVT